MADYYTLLSKAVSNLPKAGPEPARKAIYERARKALVRQLRSLGPSLSEADIAREEAALEAAIGKLETQFGSSSASSVAATRSPSSTFGARPADSARPSSFTSPPRPAPNASGGRIAMPDTPLARPAPPPLSSGRPQPQAPRPGVSPGASPADRFAASVAAARSAYAPASAAPRPTLGGASAAMAPLGPRPSTSRYAPPPARRTETQSLLPDAPAFRRASASNVDSEEYAPSIEAEDDYERAAYSPNEADGLRPSAPVRVEGGRRSAMPWIIAAVVIGVALSVALFAFLWRQKPQDLAIKEPVATPSVEASAPAKIVERVGGAAATPGATPAASDAATPTPATTPAPGATTAPTPGATNAQAPANPGLAVAARAAMLVAVPSDPQKPAVNLGSVTWSEIPAAAGQPATLAIKAEADIPDLKMHAVMTMRKNSDPSLPASHTIELRLTFADGSDIKGIKDLRVPMMRRDDPPAQDALSGVRVKISDSYFLIGLNRGDAELARNLDLVANRGWFDFPMLFNDDRAAKLTFEKGADGERIVNDALAAWK
ncbi:MAG: hypothetical protein E7774_16100 [Bradyrhizobium sp.]|nr:MAG: hypothetical protein E7774_16100 [Bradyrhizobium sp.]